MASSPARILYTFPTSVFSRRARLALLHKKIDDVRVVDARAEPRYLEEAHKRTPFRTMPVFVDRDGRALADSTVIAQYLDLAYPDAPPLFPRDAAAAHDALTVVLAVDIAMNALVDMGTRHWDLRHDPSWSKVAGERISRAQDAIDFVAAHANGRTTLAGDAWSVADIWALTSARWVAGMPARAATAPLVAQILTLGFRLPEALVTWAKQHEGRADVKAIYES